jgi:two-component system, chemotaxis family, CheB/CheR fusion protein
MPRQPGPSTATPRASRQRRRAVANNEAGFPVVAVGASAGGLEAFRTLLTALPARSGMAFILVQHLDPTHPSMSVDLLALHTRLTVLEARPNMRLEPDHVFIIPPGRFLAMSDGTLQLSLPRNRQGVRMPFDFLLHSLAAAFGERAVCVVLSGTGNDGSAGAKEVKEAGGLVMAQTPEEAEFDGGSMQFCGVHYAANATSSSSFAGRKPG